MNEQEFAQEVVARLDPYAALRTSYQIFCNWLHDMGGRPDVYYAAIDSECHRLLQDEIDALREIVSVCCHLASATTKEEKDRWAWEIDRVAKLHIIQDWMVIMQPYDHWDDFQRYNALAERGDIMNLHERLARETA